MLHSMTISGPSASRLLPGPGICPLVLLYRLVGDSTRGRSCGGSRDPDRTSFRTIGVKPCVLVCFSTAGVDIYGPGVCNVSYALDPCTSVVCI